MSNGRLIGLFRHYIGMCKTGVLPEHWANDLAVEDITCGER